jgi:hypothetical protein
MHPVSGGSHAGFSGQLGWFEDIGVTLEMTDQQRADVDAKRGTHRDTCQRDADARRSFEPAAHGARDGAPPVDLISGGDLCDLLKHHERGVVTTRRTIEDLHVITDCFDDI